MDDERIDDQTYLSELQLKFMQFAMDHASIEIYWLGRDARIYYANNHACKTLGYTKEEFLQLQLHDLDPNYPVERWSEHWQELKRDRTQSFETLHKRKNGEIFPVEVLANYVCIDGHEYNIGFAKDITERKRAGDALRESEEKYRGLFENAGDLAYGTDLNGNFTAVSESLSEVTGYGRDELINAPIGKILTPENLELARRMTGAKLAAEKQVTRYELEITDKEGRQIPLELVSALTYRNGVPVGVQGIGRDISERKRLETDLRIAAAAFESQEPIVITDAGGVIRRVNKAFTKSTGYTAEEAVGRTPRILKSDRHDGEFFHAMWESLHRSGTWQGEIWDRRKNGEVYPKLLTISAVRGDDGKVTHYVGSDIDITERKAVEEETQYLAFYDPLTQLPNRRLLQDRLQQALASSARSGRDGALMFFDLDNFKNLNDTLGHDIGDLLLQQVAQRLTICVREGDTVARLGGDEFVVILVDLSEHDLEAAAKIETIGEKILADLSQPYRLDAHVYRCTASIGVTVFNGHQHATGELMKQADIAMYQAKKAGRNALRFFDRQMQESISARVTLESELHAALEKHQFRLHYQIQVDGSNQPLGAEALIRWAHPERGLLPPAQFMPLAEETGLVLPIGQWALETACARLKAWEQAAQTRDLVLAVNVSARQFCRADFVAQVKAAVQRHAINPMRLKLELTEGMLPGNLQDAIAAMCALSEMGVRFALDDFGTGYSSLQHLKKLPLEQLKIDLSFVRDIATDSSDREIVCAIIAIANSLSLNVIAEGVETEVQRQFLLQAGCTNFQGYLFGRPVPIEEFEASLKPG